MSVTLYLNGSLDPDDSTNLSNVNFAAIFSLLEADISEELYGEFNVEQCKNILRKIAEMPMDIFMTPTRTEERIIFVGRDLHYVMRKLCAIVEILTKAIETGQSVKYA